MPPPRRCWDCLGLSVDGIILRVVHWFWWNCWKRYRFQDVELSMKCWDDLVYEVPEEPPGYGLETVILCSAVCYRENKMCTTQPQYFLMFWGQMRKWHGRRRPCRNRKQKGCWSKSTTATSASGLRMRGSKSTGRERGSKSAVIRRPRNSFYDFTNSGSTSKNKCNIICIVCCCQNEKNRMQAQQWAGLKNCDNVNIAVCITSTCRQCLAYLIAITIQYNTIVTWCTLIYKIVQ